MNGINISTASEIRFGNTLVSEIYFGSNKLWPLGHDYSQDYFTIVSSSDNNTISWRASNANLTNTISISTDNGTTWTQKTSDTTGVTLATLNNGDKMLVKSNTVHASSPYYNYFISSGNFNVEGNIMSYVFGDNFIGQTSFPDPSVTPSAYIFFRLFYNCTHLISAENLILPVTTLSSYCYNDMFRGCSSLTTTPELPATTLADNCYQGMFDGCSSLITAPELPATTLAYACYNTMFYGCTSLNYIKCLATDISAFGCTLNWLDNVSASGTFVKNANMTNWTTGTGGIPSGWTIQNA